VLAVVSDCSGFIHRDFAAACRRCREAPASESFGTLPKGLPHACVQVRWCAAVGGGSWRPVLLGLRFLEAVGLWKDRNWANGWVRSAAGIYIPVEIYEAARKATATRLVLFALNVAVVDICSGICGRKGRLRASTHR